VNKVGLVDTLEKSGGPFAPGTRGAQSAPGYRDELGHRAPEADRPGRGGYKAALGDCPNSCGGVNKNTGLASSSCPIIEHSFFDSSRRITMSPSQSAQVERPAGSPVAGRRIAFWMLATFFLCVAGAQSSPLARRG